MFDVSDVDLALGSGDPAFCLRADLVALGFEDRDGWTAAALSARLVELLEVRDRLEAELTRLTTDWHRTRAWEADGALSPTAWLTHRAPIARRDAARLVKTAEVVDRAPRLAAALHTGDTTAAHAGALAGVMSPRRLPLLADHDAVLAEHAANLSTSDFTKLARRWAGSPMITSHATSTTSTGPATDSTPRSRWTDGWTARSTSIPSRAPS